jgi:KaiC/GvpD/RAD55 family RecA-like ATPase
VDEVQEGKSILVKGPSQPDRREFVLDLLKSDNGVLADPSVLVTTNELGKKVAQRYHSRLEETDIHPPLGIIDCMPNPSPYSVRNAAVAQVGGPGDLTGVGVEVTKMIESMNNRGYEKVRLVLDSICPMTMYTDIEVLFRFLQTMVGCIQATGSVGVFTIDPESHDEKTVSMITYLFDYVLDVDGYSGFGVVDSAGFD